MPPEPTPSNVVKLPTNPQANGTDVCPKCGKLAGSFIWGRCWTCAEAEEGRSA